MDDFFRDRYKKFLIFPAILFIIMLFLVFVYPGITPGIDLTGGNEITIRSSNPLDEQAVYNILSEKFSLSELSVSSLSSPTNFGTLIRYSKLPLVLEADELITQAELFVDDDAKSIELSKKAIFILIKEENEYSNAKLALLAAQNALISYKKNFEIEFQNVLSTEFDLGNDFEFQRKEVSPTIGSSALFSMLQVSIWALILIIATIFIAFRKLIPTLAIIISLIFDILAGLTGMALLGIPLSIITIPTLLMLIGYSVDTDIMLTARLLKNKTGTNGERATTSMKTGLTMTITTLAALSSMVLFSYFFQIDVIFNIAIILLFGLLGDIVATWFMNAPILLWFLEAKK